VKILVLYGGQSDEREVSLKSGAAVAAALQRLDYNVVLVDAVLPIEAIVEQHRPDLVFIALHGGFGEDGHLQAQLERLGVPYTGSGVEASRLAMNKVLSKEVFLQHGIPTPRGVVAEKGKPVPSIAEIGYPVVVKPANLGSTIGVSVAETPSELGPALDAAFRKDDTVLLEQFLAGPEFTVGILDDQPLPVIQIEYPGRIFSEDLKYRSKDTIYVVDPRIEWGLEQKLLRLAQKAHEALGCRHVSRVDLRADAEMNPYVLEVNTIPGMTERSLVPKAARARGISFERLCERILQLALGENCRAQELHTRK